MPFTASPETPEAANTFALLGSNEDRNTRKGALSEAVRSRGLRLCESVTLRFKSFSDESRMMAEFFKAHPSEMCDFKVETDFDEWVVTASIKAWAALFDRVFEHFATFGDEWNDNEDGADKLCQQFEQTIGSYGLYEHVRFITF